MSDAPMTEAERIERGARVLATGAKIGEQLMDQFERDGVTPEEGCAALAYVAASVLHCAESGEERQAVANMLSSAMNVYLARLHDDDEGDGVPTPGPLPEHIQ